MNDVTQQLDSISAQYRTFVDTTATLAALADTTSHVDLRPLILQAASDAASMHVQVTAIADAVQALSQWSESAEPPAENFVPTRVGTDSLSPTPGTTNQTLTIVLHGSGDNYQAGDRYEVAVSGDLADVGYSETFKFCVQQAGVGRVVVRPLDKQPRAGLSINESRWLGWLHETAPGVFSELNLWTERRVYALIEWLRTHYPQISFTSVDVVGNSMGAWGVATMFMRRPDLVAAIYGNRMRLRFNATGGISLSVWEQADGVAEFSVAQSPMLSVIDGGGSAAEHLDLIAYAANPANKMPLVIGCVGRNDGYMQFSDHAEFIRVMLEMDRPIAYSWNDGNHSTGDTMASVLMKNGAYHYGMCKIGVGMPLLRNSSRDKDPAIDLVGTINEGFVWRNVDESATSWTCQIKNVVGLTEVDVKPHSDIFTHPVAAQRITCPSGSAWVTVTFSAP